MVKAGFSNSRSGSTSSWLGISAIHCCARRRERISIQLSKMLDASLAKHKLGAFGNQPDGDSVFSIQYSVVRAWFFFGARTFQSAATWNAGELQSRWNHGMLHDCCGLESPR